MESATIPFSFEEEGKIELDIKINYKDKEYQFNISKVNSNALFVLKNDKDFPPEIYEEQCDFEKLKKQNLLFSLYNKIGDIILFISLNIKENKYILEITKEKAIFKIKSGVIGIPDISIFIKKKEIGQNNLIPLLCEEVKNLKEKIKILENNNLNNKVINNKKIINNEKLSLKIVKKYENYNEIIYGINVFPNGNFIAYSGNRKIGSKLFVFEGKTQKNVYKIKGSHKHAISYLEIIDDNNFITSSFDKKIIIWSIKGIKPKEEQTLEGHSGEIFKVIFINPKIYSSGQNGEIIIWEKKEKKYICVKILKAGEQNVYNLLQLNVNQFISCNGDGKLICWNLQNYNEEFNMKVANSKWNNGIIKIDEMKIIYGGVNYIQLINLKDKIIEKSIKINSMVFSMELLNNKYLIIGDNRGKIEIRENNSLNIITQKNFKIKEDEKEDKNKDKKKGNNISIQEIFYGAKKINENSFLICSNKKKIYIMKIKNK